MGTRGPQLSQPQIGSELAVEAPAQPGKRTREHTRIARALGHAIADFDMIQDGDRIMCAVSGGKDSYTLHLLLLEAQRRAPVDFEVIAVNVDQGHPGFPTEVLPNYMRKLGAPLHVINEDTYSIVKSKIPEGKTMCSLCSRLRRGILYRVARELGCNKIALGHHRDDIVTTLMLNLVFSGQLKAMPPKLVNDEGDIVVIRPLAYGVERDIASFAAQQRFPIIPCDLCGSQPNHQRALIGELLAELERRQPDVRATMLAALRNVRPSHLLDSKLWSQLDLEVARDANLHLIELRR